MIGTTTDYNGHYAAGLAKCKLDKDSMLLQNICSSTRSLFNYVYIKYPYNQLYAINFNRYDTPIVQYKVPICIVLMYLNCTTKFQVKIRVHKECINKKRISHHCQISHHHTQTQTHTLASKHMKVLQPVNHSC